MRVAFDHVVQMNLEQTSFELALPSELGCEKLVRHVIAWLAPRLHFSAARTADIQTAVSEACINAIEHGNQGRADLRITVVFTVTPTHLEVIVADAGLAIYHAAESPPVSIHEKVGAGAPARGMGLLLIRPLVDEAEFLSPVPGQGNRFRLRFCRPPPGAALAPGASPEPYGGS